MPPQGVTPSEFREDHGIYKTRMNGLSCGEEIMTRSSAVLIQCQRVTNGRTDGQKDRQTDVQPISITCFSIADARKNYSTWCMSNSQTASSPAGSIIRFVYCLSHSLLWWDLTSTELMYAVHNGHRQNVIGPSPAYNVVLLCLTLFDYTRYNVGPSVLLHRSRSHKCTSPIYHYYYNLLSTSQRTVFVDTRLYHDRQYYFFLNSLFIIRMLDLYKDSYWTLLLITFHFLFFISDF